MKCGSKARADNAIFQNCVICPCRKLLIQNTCSKYIQNVQQFYTLRPGTKWLRSIDVYLMAYNWTSRKCVWALDNTKPGLLPLKSWFSYPPQLSMIKKKKRREKTDIKTETNTSGRFITPILNQTNQSASPRPCIARVCSICVCYLSSTIKKGRLSFPLKCFLRAVVHLEESDPFVNENCCWFGVMILVGVLCMHMCPTTLSSHSGTGKYWSKKCITSTECSQRA